MNHIGFLESIVSLLFPYLCPCLTFSVSPATPLPTHLLTTASCTQTLRDGESPQGVSWEVFLRTAPGRDWKEGVSRRGCSASVRWQQRPRPPPRGALELGWPITVILNWAKSVRALPSCASAMPQRGRKAPMWGRSLPWEPAVSHVPTAGGWGS